MTSKYKMKLSWARSPADCTYFAGSLNILAQIYMIPFKVEMDSQSDSFRLTSNKLRQVICGVIHTVAVSLIVICGYIKCFTFGLQTKRFEYIIYTLDYTLNAVFTLALVKVLWRDQNLIERFMNTPAYRESAVSRRKIWLAVSPCMLIFICDLHLTRSSDVSSCLILSAETANNSFIMELSLITAKMLFSLLLLISQLFLYIGEGLCYTLSINIWEICKNLDNKLQWDTPFKQGIEFYNEHRTTVGIVNSFSSTLFLINLMSSLVYYAQAPMVYYFGHQTYRCENAVMMAYIVITLIIWGFAGECHARTRKTIKKWVDGKQEKADACTPVSEQFKLAALSHNLDSDPIALSCCFFNVTYGFEASMLGLLISYNIIIFQMEEQGNTVKASTSVIQ